MSPGGGTGAASRIIGFGRRINAGVTGAGVTRTGSPDRTGPATPPPGTDRSGQRGVEVCREHGKAPVRRGRQRTYHDGGTGRQPAETVPHQVTQPTADPVAVHRAAHRTRHHEADAYWRVGCCGGGWVSQIEMHHDRAMPAPTTSADSRDELSAAPQPRGRGKHGNGSGLKPRGGCGPCGAVRR